MPPFSKPEMIGRVAGPWLTDKPLRLVTKPCVCGGEITADRTDPADAVRRHNQTVQHLRWWAWAGDD